MSLIGNDDFYTRIHPHNFRMFQNPETGKFEAMPWDLDRAFRTSVNSPLWTSPAEGQVNKLFDLPQVSRLLYGHFDELIQTTFNRDFAQTWASHYGSVFGSNYSSQVNYVESRANGVLAQLPALAPFQITTNNGSNFSVDSNQVVLAGTGSYKIREIMIDGFAIPLDVTWLDDTNWQAVVNLNLGTNDLTFRALDFSGSEIHSDSIVVTSTDNSTTTQDHLRITEINYHPFDSTGAERAAGFIDSDEFEFVEILNSHPTGTINLNGMQLANGVTYSFGNIDLQPGERVVVVENTAAFNFRYGNSITPLGQYTGGLSNSGETLLLVDSAGVEISSVTYDDSGLWSVGADGDGASLVLNSETPSDSLVGKYYSWRTSVEYGGTPGTASAIPSGVVINEIEAHTDLPDVDSIELFNASGSSIDIGGWFLSDSGNDLFQYQIPASTVLSAGGYVVFDENDFNFALSSLGENVYLTRNVGGLAAFEDVVEFGATFNGDSVGRLPNGSGRLAHIDSPTLGQANIAHGVADLIISEVHYNPLPPTGNPVGVGDNDIEFLEVYNRSNQAIDLSRLASAWRCRFRLPSGHASARSEHSVVGI